MAIPASPTNLRITLNVDTFPKMLLLTQSALLTPAGAEVRCWPDYVASNAAVADTLPYDGIIINSSYGTELMDGTLWSKAELDTEWTAFAAVNWTRMQHNYARVLVLRPNDFFDSWSNTVTSFGNFAAACRDAGLKGICFDNEEYTDFLWLYPDNVNYSGTKTLAEYYTQTQLRGNQIITAVQDEWPECRMMVLLSPADNSASSPSGHREWTADPNVLAGAFTVGLMEGSTNAIIDGNETSYAYRNETTEFVVSNEWRKHGIVEYATQTPFIPTAMNASWPNKISISNAFYSTTIGYANGQTRTMNTTIAPDHLAMVLRNVEEYAWLYWDISNMNWYNTVGGANGVSTTWYNLIEAAWLAK